MTHWNPLPLIDKWFTSFIDFLKEKNIFAILMLFVIATIAGMGYIIYAQNERIGQLNKRGEKFDSVLVARDAVWIVKLDNTKDRYQSKIDSMTAQQIKDQSATIRRLNAIDSARRASEVNVAVMSRQWNNVANKASSIKRKADSLDKMLKKNQE